MIQYHSLTLISRLERTLMGKLCLALVQFMKSKDGKITRYREARSSEVEKDVKNTGGLNRDLQANLVS